MAETVEDAADGADEDKSKRAPPLRAELNDGYIKRLRLSKPPLGYDDKGKLVFATEDDPRSKSYILWDAARDSPPGFGVKVAGKKTYILRRKIHGKSILAKVGNVADFTDISLARKRAAEMARKMVETGRNPNELAREKSANELTLGDAMDAYREHLRNRARPASENTLRVYDRVRKKIAEWEWATKKVVDLRPQDIVLKFIVDKDRIPTANEQRFRWPSRAVAWCVEREKLAALVQRREPALAANPFYVLVNEGLYRDDDTLEAERQARGVRNPLTRGEDGTLAKFLEAAWSKKDQNDNCTGVHYLILMLLWGCRKSEHANLVWGELLDPVGSEGVGRTATSHVWLRDDGEWGPYVFFYRTKNRKSHRLPLTPFALALLKQRQKAAAEEARRRGFEAKSRKFVFPARSRYSNTGHYSDATDLLDDIREEIGVQKLTRHDLRRTFGRVARHGAGVGDLVGDFLNHSKNVTDRYMEAEWADLKEAMSKIEQEILSKAPNVYNDLKPVDWPMLPAPPRHVCRPPKPRTGRPRKTAVQDSAASANEPMSV
jgi:integrase